MAGLGTEVLRDDAVADSAELSMTSHARAEEDIRAATTGKQGLLSRSIELDADALVVRATVLTYQWIDELREAAYETLGAVAGRAIGYLAPNVALGGAIVSAGLIETDALDRDGVADYLSELAAANPELMDHVTSGGGGLLDGLQMRSALTVPAPSGDAGRQAARGGLRALGVDPMRQDSSAALRDVAAGLLSGPRPAPADAPLVEAPRVPTSLVDLMTTLEELDARVLVHRTAPGRYVAYVGRPPPEPTADEDGPALRLTAGDLTPYAAEVARTIAAAVAGDADAHVMVVGTGAGGAVAAQLAAQKRPLPFVVDQVVTAGAPAAQVPRLPDDHPDARARGPRRPGRPPRLAASAPATRTAPRSSSTPPARRPRASTSRARAPPTARRTSSPSSTGCAGWATWPDSEQVVHELAELGEVAALRHRHHVGVLARDGVAGVPVPAVLGVEPVGVPRAPLHLLEPVEREVGVVGARVAEDQQ